MRRMVVASSAALLASACTLLVTTDALSGGTPGALDAADGRASGDGAAAPADASEAACPAPAPGLVAYFRFDETTGSAAADCSGAGHDGVVAAPHWVAGKRGGALEFDGVGTCVILDSSTRMLSAGAFSISAFVDVAAYTDDSSTKARYLVSKANEVPDKNSWRFASDALSSFSFKLGAQTGATEVSTPNGQPANRWVHVAAVFDPDKKLEIWVDGVLLGNTTAPSFFSDDPLSSVHVGCLKSSSFFEGAVDELRLYARALDEAEIAALAR